MTLVGEHTIGNELSYVFIVVTTVQLLPMCYATNHASIAYRKQLPPQRTVGTIGSVWQESTPSKETTGPAQTRKAKGYESEQSEMPNGACAAFA